MNPTAQDQKPKPQSGPDRTPIRIARLLFTVANVHGVKLPDGPDGKSEKILPNLTAGEHGGVTIAIAHLPWLRVFEVTKTKRVTRSGAGPNAKEIETWEPMGGPFRIPEAWCVSVPAGE
jgi:hypothetical protein